MQTLGHSGERTSSAPAPSLLERASWLDKLPLTLICGALLGFSSAGYGVWWLAWFCLAPLLLLVFGSRGRTEALLTGLAFGLAYHLVSLRWLFDLHPLTWLALPGWASVVVAAQAWLLESLHQSVLFALFAIFVHTLPMRAGFMPHWSRPFFPMVLSVPIIWLFLQWIVAPSPFFLGVPIDQLAYSQSRMPEVIQVAKLGGAQLVDFMLLLVNSAIAAVIMQLTNVSRRLESRADLISDELGAVVDVAVVTLVVCACLSWGEQEVHADAAMVPYKQAKAEFSPAIPVAVAQPDVTIDEKASLSAQQNNDRVMALIGNQGVPLIVLPSDVLDNVKRGTEPLRYGLAQLALQQKKDVIVGFRDRTNAGVFDGVRVFSADKFNTDSTYTKYRLIPLAEYTPIGLLSGLLPQSMREHLMGSEEHLRADKLTTLRALYGRVGASIGAEIVYPDLIVSEVNRGASLLVNLADISVFHNSMLGQQLLAAGCLRAVENGRYLVIASNTGVSAVVDPCGVVTSASVPARKGVLLDRVQFLHRKTPFARMCLWTPLYH